ncbi:class I SAM-dependent methyltransferase [Rudanella paleaurantiibacter]|uniref:class I SAM-dependent methyltransferase n=1 Tax=Rudanella paleaurantiibacter TaxID=2614655 RepID=UPI001627D5D4|nr:methyltransferase domain-containing protein [Rudanella paleaurantiibacter]
MAVDENIYNKIYSNAHIVPGYDRYYRFANDVLKVRNPFLFLSEIEDTYWSIYHFVKEHNKQVNPKILEVGCGLGYLTYSLNKDGYNALGLDISEKAVAEAKKKYGDYYVCADVHDFARQNHGQFDIVILTEVIEHIPNPKNFVSSLKSLLSSSGKLLITTPSKDAEPDASQYWNTELPPVHLWWFSKNSFKELASSLNMNCDFIDFTPFVSRQTNYPKLSDPWRTQTLNRNGQVLFTVDHSDIKHSLKRGLIDAGLMTYFKRVIKILRKDTSSIPATKITAILTIDNGQP